MIRLSNVSATYGKENVISKLNLEFEKDKSYSIIGSSGCGKTTLLYVLAGIKKPDEGKVFVNNKEVFGVLKSTSILSQSYSILPWKTVFENISFVLKTKGLNKKEILEITNETLEDLEIFEFRNKYPNELSGGQKQRAALGCGIASRPSLFLLDEPTSALDSFTKENIQKIILKMIKKYKRTFVTVTHDIQEAALLGEKIIVMEKAGVKKIIDNPYFNILNIVEEIDFYKFCLELRACLSTQNF